MQLVEYQKAFESFLSELKEKSPQNKFSDRGFAMPEEISENALLFIGLNPSYPKKNPGAAGFYKLSQDAGGYFKKFSEIAQECGTELQWSHLDLLPIRETNQKKVETKVVFDCHELTNKYLHKTVKPILEKAKPKAVIVVNATARLLLGKDQEVSKKIWLGYKFRFDEVNGACYVTNSDGLKNVPFFFSGMLSGQRALNLGSYERLKWHVGKILNNDHV